MTTRSMDSRITGAGRRAVVHQRHADADLVGTAGDVVGHRARRGRSKPAAAPAPEERVGLREELFLLKPQFDLFELRGDVHQREVLVDLPDGLADGAGNRAGGGRAVRTSNTGLPTRVCMYGTIHRRRRRIADAVVFDVAEHADDLEIGAAVSRFEPIRRPTGFSFAKYLLTAASLIITTFGCRVAVAVGEASVRRSTGIPMSGEEVRRDHQAVDIVVVIANRRSVIAALHEDAGAVHITRESAGADSATAETPGAVPSRSSMSR